MQECYLHSHAKNLSGARAPIDHYVYKGLQRPTLEEEEEGEWNTRAENEGDKTGSKGHFH